MKKKTTRKQQKPKQGLQALYTYVTPKNGAWVRMQAKKQGTSYSFFMNKLIDGARK